MSDVHNKETLARSFSQADALTTWPHKRENTKPDLKISGAKYCRGTDASGITCL